MTGVCVVGGGIMGLPTALEIQKAEPRLKVTLISSDFSPNTTGDLSAGFWRPIYLPDPRTDLITKWGEETFREIEELWKEDPDKYGVSRVSGFEVKHNSFPDPSWKNTVHNYRRISVTELKSLGFADFKDGIFYTTFCLEPSQYLPILLERFKNNGGKVVQKRITNLKQLAKDYSTLVNCTGLGAGELVGDKSVFPIRGQIFRVRAPFARHFYCIGDEFYLLPNRNVVILGGTHQENSWDTTVSKEDSKKIWNGLVGHLPWLKEAVVVHEGVGLRPGRPEIRLEAERIVLNGKTVSVVHNYGHGGSGVTLHAGCSREAAKLSIDSFHHNGNTCKL